MIPDLQTYRGFKYKALGVPLHPGNSPLTWYSLNHGNILSGVSRVGKVAHCCVDLQWWILGLVSVIQMNTELQPKESEFLVLFI